MGEDARYVRVVPNSHSFESLQNIITHATFRSEEITLDYLITGFKNTLERGIDLVFDHESMTEAPPLYYFANIEGILHNLAIKKEEDDFNLEKFLDLIVSTLRNGFDLKHKNIKEMKKEEVYNRVDGELDYQELRWVVRRDANGTPDESKPPAEWLSYIRKHVRLADDAIYNLDDEEAMAQFRKIAGLAVRAMTIHGCPEREIPEELLNAN